MYTFEQISQMSYDQLRSLKLSDLPEKMQNNLKEKLAKGCGELVNTGTHIYAISPDGKRLFDASRHSDRRTGSSVWSVIYAKRAICLCRDVIGYTFDVRLICLGRTAEGVIIPQRISYKKDVVELMKKIGWLKTLIENNGKS